METRARRRAWEILEVARPGDSLSRVVDWFILALIVLSVLSVILESIAPLRSRYGDWFIWLERVSVTAFTIEYLGRLWACSSSAEVMGRWGRLRFFLKPMTVVDLLAILPFYLPFIGVDLRVLRLMRLARIVRIAKVGRYYSSLRLIRNVLVGRREELILTTVVMMILLVMSSSLLYYAEREAQPESFSNIPAAMWWAVSTLTTVGYGDIVPITISGKVMAAIIACLGVGMFALPAGILGSGFVEYMQDTKVKVDSCPHCGETLRTDRSGGKMES